jgi:hypothetical protein
MLEANLGVGVRRARTSMGAEGRKLLVGLGRAKAREATEAT